jgi:hypothetical protein
MGGWCAGWVGMGKLYCEGNGIVKGAVVEGEAASIARAWQDGRQICKASYHSTTKDGLRPDDPPSVRI